MRTETSYLGLRLEHPFMAGTSPLGYRVDTVKRLEGVAAAAIHNHPLTPPMVPSIVNVRIPAKRAAGPSACPTTAAPNPRPGRPAQQPEDQRCSMCSREQWSALISTSADSGQH